MAPPPSPSNLTTLLHHNEMLLVFVFDGVPDKDREEERSGKRQEEIS